MCTIFLIEIPKNLNLLHFTSYISYIYLTYPLFDHKRTLVCPFRKRMFFVVFVKSPSTKLTIYGGIIAVGPNEDSAFPPSTTIVDRSCVFAKAVISTGVIILR